MEYEVESLAGEFEVAWSQSRGQEGGLAPALYLKAYGY